MDNNPVIDFQVRQSRLKDLLEKENIEAALIKKPENTFYLSNFEGTNINLVVFKNKDKKSILLTDNRYYDSAVQKSSDCLVELIENELINNLSSLFKENETKKIVLEADYLSISFYNELKLNLPDLEIINKESLLENIRMIKEPIEVSLIEKAASVSDKVLEIIVSELKEGITEKDIATEIIYQVRKNGADDVSFEPIVASGPNSAVPHAKASNRRLSKGDLIKLDFGAKKDGYCSDLTRTMVLGKAKDWQLEIFNSAIDSMGIAMESISPGIIFSEIDNNVRKYLKSINLEQFFIHNLGHGVGLEVHELPIINGKSNFKAECGMIFTLEPGIYYSGKGGVRHEDLIYLSESGPVKINKSSNKLIEL